MSLKINATAAKLGPIPVQISPFGRFLKRFPDGTTTTQVCDQLAFERVLATWIAAGRPKILVDFDHNKQRTAAGAWITELSIDPTDGLMGLAEFTPSGSQAVTDYDYRFLSPDWDVADDDGRPFHLRTVGMTNRQNIPVRPIINANEAPAASTAGPAAAKPNEGKPNMENIALALGLEATASEEEVIAKITALLEALANIEEEVIEVEAEAAAQENAERIENSAEFITAYKANPAAVKRAMAALKASAAPAARRVTNSNTATFAGGLAPRAHFASPAAAKQALADQPVGTRRAFYAKHRAEIDG